jgi:hypothetical protein
MVETPGLGFALTLAQNAPARNQIARWPNIPLI